MENCYHDSMPEAVDIIQKDADNADVLRETAQSVTEDEFGSEKLADIIDQMKAALHATDDGVAIAAPQIGVSKRIFLVRDKVFTERGDVPNKDKAFVNPELINTSQKTTKVCEGCLSVRNVYGEVERAQKATVRAQKEDGEVFRVGGSGLLAQIFQHEIEHLDGILFTDKASDLRKISEEDRRQRVQKSKNFENNN